MEAKIRNQNVWVRRIVPPEEASAFGLKIGNVSIFGDDPIQEIRDGNVTSIGNGARVSIPRKFIGHRVTIIIYKAGHPAAMGTTNEA